jgi:hypothetical protein
VAAIKEEQEGCSERNENGRTPEGKRRDVILIGGFGRHEIDHFVENHCAADTEGCGCEKGKKVVACSECENESGWDNDEGAGEEVVEQIASGVNVLDADEVEVEALAQEGEEHGDEDQKQGLLWGEVEMRSRD